MEFERKVIELDVNDVLPNRFQPRIKFNEDSINELSDSIKEHGVIQPIVVRSMGDKYEIIAGERRYKASLLAGKTTIPAVITNLNDKDSAEVALIENVQRKDLTPIEEAISYKKILDMGYLTQEELAIKLGKSQSTIANKLRLLNLDEEVQEAVLDEKISERHARSLLKLNDFNDQKKMVKMIIENRMTVRKTDEEIAKLLNNNQNDDGEVNVLKPTFIDNPFNVKRIIPEKINPVEVNKNNLMPSIEPIVIMDDIEQMPAISEDDISLLNNENNSNMEVDPILGIPVAIPTAPIEDVQTQVSNDEPMPPIINTGYMDIDKIENNAQDIKPLEKEPADINSLLKPSIIGQEEEIKNETETTAEEELKVGKFFSLPIEEEQIESKEMVLNEESGLTDAFNFELNMVDTAPITSIEPVVPSDMETTSTDVENKMDSLLNSSLVDDSQSKSVDSALIEDSTSIQSGANSLKEFNLDDLIPTSTMDSVSLDPEQKNLSNAATANEVLSLDSGETIAVSNNIKETNEFDNNLVVDRNSLDLDSLVAPAEENKKEVKLGKNSDIVGALSNVRSVVNTLESNGYIVDTEEFDFEGEYQIIIKVKK